MVTVVPMPASANPTLAELAANANQAALTDLGDFRTLRPKTRNYELNGTYATRLAPWLSGTGSLRLSRNLGPSLRGLPTVLPVFSPDNAFSPFSTDVALAFYGRDPFAFPLAPRQRRRQPHAQRDVRKMALQTQRALFAIAGRFALRPAECVRGDCARRQSQPIHRRPSRPDRDSHRPCDLPLDQQLGNLVFHRARRHAARGRPAGDHRRPARLQTRLRSTASFVRP